MRRLLFSLLIAAAVVLPAAAQDISVPLMMPQIELSPDGTVLAVYESPAIVDFEITPDRLPIRLYDAASGAEIGTLEGTQNDLTNDVAFSPDGTRLASVHANGQLLIWDVAGQTVIQQYDWLPMGNSRVNFMPDGSRLALIFSSGQYNNQAIFDLNAGAIVDIFQVRPATFRELQDSIGDIAALGRYGVLAQAISEQGALYGTTPNGEVFVWDMEARTRTVLYPEAEGAPMRQNVRSLQILDDGSLLFYDDLKAVTVRIVAGGTQTEYPFGGPSFALSDEGVLAYVQERALYVVNLTQDSPEPALVETEIDLRGMPQLAFLPDGRLLVGSFISGEETSTIYRVTLN